jgi:hypothetical protein
MARGGWRLLHCRACLRNNKSALDKDVIATRGMGVSWHDNEMRWDSTLSKRYELFLWWVGFIGR